MKPARHRRAAKITLLAVALALPFAAGCAAAHAHPTSERGVDLRAHAVAMLRCTLLVPLRYNNGTAVPERELRRIEDRLFSRFDGYTIAGRVRGAYRMADGKRAEDESLLIWIAVPPVRVAELREEAARIAADLRQESIYFEHGDGQVEFVSARAGGEP